MINLKAQFTPGTNPNDYRCVSPRITQAEMINLKAQCLSALGHDNVAHETFSEALMLFTLCVEAWVSHPESCPGTVSMVCFWQASRTVHAFASGSGRSAWVARHHESCKTEVQIGALAVLVLVWLVCKP